jgi:hypothetical protein
MTLKVVKPSIWPNSLPRGWGCLQDYTADPDHRAAPLWGGKAGGHLGTSVLGWKLPW